MKEDAGSFHRGCEISFMRGIPSPRSYLILKHLSFWKLKIVECATSVSSLLPCGPRPIGTAASACSRAAAGRGGSLRRTAAPRRPWIGIWRGEVGAWLGLARPRRAPPFCGPRACCPVRAHWLRQGRAHPRCRRLVRRGSTGLGWAAIGRRCRNAVR